jgi:hypothetical protein
MLRWPRANTGVFVAAAFIPSEPNAAVASVTKPVGGCVAGYRAISQIRSDVGGGIRTITSITMQRVWESPVRPIARIGCCVSPQPNRPLISRGRLESRPWGGIPTGAVAEADLIASMRESVASRLAKFKFRASSGLSASYRSGDAYRSGSELRGRGRAKELFYRAS